MRGVAIHESEVLPLASRLLHFVRNDSRRYPVASIGNLRFSVELQSQKGPALLLLLLILFLILILGP